MHVKGITLCQSSQERGILCGERGRGREEERLGERLDLGGGALDIAPLRVLTRYCRKGPRIPVLDLSRKLLTHVKRPRI